VRDLRNNRGNEDLFQEENWSTFLILSSRIFVAHFDEAVELSIGDLALGDLAFSAYVPEVNGVIESHCSNKRNSYSSTSFTNSN